MEHIRVYVFHCIYRNAFQSDGNIRLQFLWASISFYWLPLLFYTLHCLYPFGERKNRHRSAFLTMNLRFGKFLFIFFVFADPLRCWTIISWKYLFICVYRFLFVVLVDTACWAPIIAMKVFVFFSYEISGIGQWIYFFY